jgi:hypothetical protein
LRCREAVHAEDSYSRIVFGNLAIMAAPAALDPMALRPRLSPGLPLSNETGWQKQSGPGIQARFKYKQRTAHVFGGLAILITGGDFRPMALRPRLSPGLPLSD